MGPVHGRSRDSVGPDLDTQEGCGAATQNNSETTGDRNDDWHSRLAVLADQARRNEPDRDISPSLRSSKLDEIRGKIASGFYTRPDTRAAIAEKLFESLDL